jgi:hypothetical protein
MRKTLVDRRVLPVLRRLALVGACGMLLAACGPGAQAAPPSRPTPTDDSRPSVAGPVPDPVAMTTVPTAHATSTQAATRTATSTSVVPDRQRWLPTPGTPWQWQLTTPVDLTVDVPVYDIDGVENGPDVVAALHAKGRKVICYVNAGAAENFRADYPEFPPAVLGASDGWPGERWLDIRQLDILRPIMAARFDVCQQSGFDAIEADSVDGYENDTGFPLTATDQLAYNRMLADLAHQRGLSIGLKNDVEQTPDLVGDFDFAIDEQCVEYQECAALSPFVRAGKAVFEVEYNLPNTRFCPVVTALRFSSMRKNLSLDAARWPC